MILLVSAPGLAQDRRQGLRGVSERSANLDATEATPPANELSMLVGYAIPSHYYYGVGVGARAVRRFGHLHLALYVLLHAGDAWSVDYGYGAPQQYQSTPSHFGVECGYAFDLPVGRYGASLTPLVGVGGLVVIHRTSGALGSDTLLRTFPALGWGVDLRVNLNKTWTIGGAYRMYPIGTGDLDFRNEFGSTHGYGGREGLFYHAPFVLFGWRY